MRKQIKMLDLLELIDASGILISLSVSGYPYGQSCHPTA